MRLVGQPPAQFMKSRTRASPTNDSLVSSNGGVSALTIKIFPLLVNQNISPSCLSLLDLFFCLFCVRTFQIFGRVLLSKHTQFLQPIFTRLIFIILDHLCYSLLNSTQLIHILVKVWWQELDTELQMSSDCCGFKWNNDLMT